MVTRQVKLLREHTNANEAGLARLLGDLVAGLSLAHVELCDLITILFFKQSEHVSEERKETLLRVQRLSREVDYLRNLAVKELANDRSKKNIQGRQFVGCLGSAGVAGEPRP
jgi:hypothetical protein